MRGPARRAKWRARFARVGVGLREGWGGTSFRAVERPRRITRAGRGWAELVAAAPKLRVASATACGSKERASRNQNKLRWVRQIVSELRAGRKYCARAERCAVRDLGLVGARRARSEEIQVSHDQRQGRDDEKQDEGADEDPAGNFSFVRALLIGDFRGGYGCGLGGCSGCSFGRGIGFGGFCFRRSGARENCGSGFDFVGHADSLVQFRGGGAQNHAQLFFCEEGLEEAESEPPAGRAAETSGSQAARAQRN